MSDTKPSSSPHGQSIIMSALTITTPVLLGYLAIGMAFGIMMEAAGYPWWLAMVMSLTMYAGAGQYMAVGLFTKGATLLDMGVLTFLINARHMVYGLSLLGLTKTMGKKKWYLIFALTDETYALLTNLDRQENQELHDKEALALWISALDQVYWIVGTLVGIIAGTVMPIPADHVGFALTALFMVLVLEQWFSRPQKSPFLLAALASGGAMVVAGGAMLLPAIGFALAGLTYSSLMVNPTKEVSP